MADEIKNTPVSDDAQDEMEEIECFTLTDEEGNESQFEVIGTAILDDVTYYALTELDDQLNQIGDEYVILRLEKDENDEDMLISIDNDEEFDRVADYFDDEFSDIDYDA